MTSERQAAIVCSACLTEACAQGILLCENARKAGFSLTHALHEDGCTICRTGAATIRNILEAVCRRDGISLESSVEPGKPARNYELADRLGIGREAFRLSADEVRFERIIRDITERPVDYARLAAEQAARTDPWRWYCRLCGAKGEAADPDTRDQAARAHLGQAPCGRHEITGWETAGRLLHIWTYPRMKNPEGGWAGIVNWEAGLIRCPDHGVQKLVPASKLDDCKDCEMCVRELGKM